MSEVPERIVCLSAEAADWLWRIGAWGHVAGVTAFFEQPAGLPMKPRVSGFSTARMKEIEALNPDLVITFSDVQAELAAELLKQGFSVLATNQRTLAETEATLALLGRVVRREAGSERLLAEFRERLAPVADVGRRPRVYFEEWNEPLVSGIGWVGELIERAGGVDVFAELRSKRAARERVVSPEQVCRANPEIIFASWCGKPVNRARISSRPGWQDIAAVRAGQIHEIPGKDILQPGFRLVRGYEQIKEFISALK
ncbi:MAG TPA: ABC transporter substrate-binding protein [Candidatus Polarisedimenticolia bacterium]|nr:ABC transporter substrate-binding protein [Candidatus Polarisedimenticolia bacterium]